MILCHQCGAALRENDRFCASCGASSADSGAPKDPLVGRTIGGSYTILDLVGVGGMGRVYRAEQRMLGRTVAIKVIHPHLLSDEQSVARFYTEARAASRLNHPNSVSIIDFGRTDDGILYLVMEFLQGRDLSRLMREDGPLPLARICDIVVAVLAALGEAHALGVIHRDLKPENVIIERLRTGTDLVKVVDFGLAKLLGGAQGTSITLPGLVCGTPDYMSPEQGRGEEVDERGDIYSMGVLLFELLTERLPFVADTPTNVVLKHIQSVIPDPREVAPQRAIPPSLVEIVFKAMAKKTGDRYANTDAMARALRRVANELQPGVREIACPACGLSSPDTKRFCGECGAQLQQHITPAAPRMSLPPRMSIVSGEHAVFVGRRREVEQIEQLRKTDRGPRALHVVGEEGIGKTRLLAEIAMRAAADGDLVVGAGPHESGAAVAYYPIRTVVLSLMGCDDVGLEAHADEIDAEHPLEARGLRELVAPTGLRGSQGLSRAEAAAMALAHALQVGMKRLKAARSVLIIDDVHRCDGLSAAVLAEFQRVAQGLPVLVLTASAHLRALALAAEAEVVTLRGLSHKQASRLMTGSGEDVDADVEGEERTLLPLYVEQLRALGLALDGVSHTLPARLADAVSQRVQRLNVSARRALQAACVLGNRCDRAALVSLLEPGAQRGIELLTGVGFLVAQGDSVEVVHPFVRDLVEASIPAEARKELQARAFELAAERHAPLEVRAHHAYGSGETYSALMLLERTGDVTQERGDPHGAVAAYRRGLELARREFLESGDTSLGDAMAGFSRKLGNSLAQRGDLTGAEGVLREALEYAGPASPARALILLAIARVVAARNKTRDAYRLLGEALEAAVLRDDDDTQAAVHQAVGELRLEEGNVVGATASLTSAVALLGHRSADPLPLARAAGQLAQILVRGQDRGAAYEALQRARELSREAHSPYLEARALSISARMSDMAGDADRARELWAEAKACAARAGDAASVRKYDRAFQGDDLGLSELPGTGTA